MGQARGELLAGAGLAEDEHGRGGLGGPLQGSAGLFERGSADHADGDRLDLVRRVGPGREVAQQRVSHADQIPVLEGPRPHPLPVDEDAIGASGVTDGDPRAGRLQQGVASGHAVVLDVHVRRVLAPEHP